MGAGQDGWSQLVLDTVLKLHCGKGNDAVHGVVVFRQWLPPVSVGALRHPNPPRVYRTYRAWGYKRAPLLYTSFRVFAKTKRRL